ncbi:uncharacterized protein LOC117795776 [Ailuropoda melanoleuca]|uniref:uncharacterized protein LOC117795776 n=1 Tax=Ailuropoda melanoleuca TaxID=9646 RepID=UPI00149466C1|nr:uncharacterized protein LOC117795776 [Ailuropoda melanoleuca]
MFPTFVPSIRKGDGQLYNEVVGGGGPPAFSLDRALRGRHTAGKEAVSPADSSLAAASPTPLPKVPEGSGPSSHQSQSRSTPGSPITVREGRPSPLGTPPPNRVTPTASNKYPYQEPPDSALWGLCHTWDLGPVTPQFPEMVNLENFDLEETLCLEYSCPRSLLSLFPVRMAESHQENLWSDTVWRAGLGEGACREDAPECLCERS